MYTVWRTLEQNLKQQHKQVLKQTNIKIANELRKEIKLLFE